MNTATRITADNEMTHMGMPTGHFSIWRDGSTVVGHADNSSAVKDWVWEGDGRLMVIFRDSTAHYHYKGVTTEMLLGLIATDSAGRYIATVIKPNCPLDFIF